MSAVEPSLSFNDILDAVKESRRGRWFLEELEQRVRKNDNTNLLDAITKLDSIVTSMGAAGADAALLARAKSAITTARQDISRFDSGDAGLSAEGRMFAKLAEMAKQTFSSPNGATPPALGNGVVRALKLVDELEADICGPLPAHISVVPKQTQQPADYFEHDASVFETPKSKPQASPAPETEIPASAAKRPQQEAVERGAKLVINRVPPKNLDDAPEPAAPIVEPAPPLPIESKAAEAPVPVKAPEAPAPAVSPVAVAQVETEEPSNRPRVVIIRRKAEDMVEVPLMDQQALAETAA